MQSKTILNQIEKYRSFVYGKVTRDEAAEQPTLLVEIAPRANGQPVCSRCGHRRSGYDTLAPRRFEYVPLWGFPEFFVYAMRRVNCPTCGVVVEQVPWAEGKRRVTTTYSWFLARWAKRLCWSDVAKAFQTNWETVFRSVERAVRWGLKHRNLEGITAIGPDEILWHRGQKYLTLVYQINDGCKRLLRIGKDRTAKSFAKFFNLLGKKRSAAIRFVCSDMWQPFLTVIAHRAKRALNILDRYHIAAKMNKAIDEVRAKEAKEMKANGYEPVLKNTRWCLLKRPGNLTDKQDVKLAELLQYNLKTVRAYLLKEDFQFFWQYIRPGWAAKFLDKWCIKVMRSRLEPMKKIAKTLRNHRSLILNWFKARGVISMGSVEGLNNKVKVTTRKSYGFRTFKATEVALFHTLGHLPEPERAHRFC